jgi:hypothetical protein
MLDGGECSSRSARRSGQARNHARDPPGLRLSFRDLKYIFRAASLSPGPASCGPERSSSLGVFQRSPLHQYQRRTSAPVSRSLDGCPSFGEKMPPFPRAPPLPFLPASTVFSVRPLAGLLRPATGPEVRPVSDLADPSAPRCRQRIASGSSILPGCAPHPSEPSPRRPPYRVTAASALPPFADLRAFLVRRIRCRDRVFPPGSTRCSPGLSSPSGFSPLDQLDGGQRDQDPLQTGNDHRWCAPRSAVLRT